MEQCKQVEPALVLLQLMTGIQMTHVPYRGTAPALNDLLGGQVQMVFCTIPSAIQYINAVAGVASSILRTLRD